MIQSYAISPVVVGILHDARADVTQDEQPPSSTIANPQRLSSACKKST